MVIRSIQNENIFIIKDPDSGRTFYGCDQEWYSAEWPRRAGCGPTVVTNVMHYLNCSHKVSGTGSSPMTKSEALSLMEKVYEYVTPTPRGIPTTKLLYDKVLKYAEAVGLEMKLDILDVPEDQKDRPQFQELLSYLDTSLLNDTPIAFLNLDNGAEKRLDSWHWVTIIGLEYELMKNTAIINILDGGIIKKIDLAKWFNTTSRGGGFVSFELRSKPKAH